MYPDSGVATREATFGPDQGCKGRPGLVGNTELVIQARL
jgi:hypothetical protein